MNPIKYFVLFAVVASLSLNACKEKEEDEPTPQTPDPVLTIETGFYENFTSYSFVNQDTIYVDSLNGTDLNVNVVESRLFIEEDLDFDSVRFEFTVVSDNDAEFFSTEDNVVAISKSVFEFGNMREIEGDVLLPIVWTSNAIPNNDTLELNPSGDVLSLTYESFHSNLKGNETRVVYP